MQKLLHITRPRRDCPFRKDTLRGWLGEQAMKKILKADSFVCHKKTDKQCGGLMLINGDQNGFVRLAGQLGIELDLSGRELVFDSQQACIEHHKYEPKGE